MPAPPAAPAAPPPPGPAALKARAAPASGPSARGAATSSFTGAFTTGNAAVTGVVSAPGAPAPRTGTALGSRANIDLGNIQVVQGTFEVADPCAEPVETFATDQQILPVNVGPNAVAEVRFGPANAGPGIVVVEMYQSLALRRHRRRWQGVPLARRAVGGVRAGGLTGAVTGAVALDTNTGPGGGGSYSRGGTLPQGASASRCARAARPRPPSRWARRR